MINWKFPENGDGSDSGLNDSGIETFYGNRWRSLAKELIQNSLDARSSDDNPVRIEFSKMSINKDAFPAHTKFSDILNRCSTYYNGDKVKKFFDKAIETMHSDNIDFLRVSDSNTVGLTGPIEDRDSNLYKLLKGSGVSNKASGSGGSFGIGKHAPFAVSNIRTVFYHSVDCQQSSIFQGVSILTTHVNNNGNKTQGKGYFGQLDGLLPLTSPLTFPNFATRSNTGTDVFVAGVDFPNDWKTTIIRCVLDEFLIAILEGQIEIDVDGLPISANTLTDTFSSYYTKSDMLSKYTYYYYEAYQNYEHPPYVKDIYNMGNIEIRILKNKNHPKRVGYFRSGMKILDKGNFHTPMQFSGVMIVRGPELNEFLRNLEPPRHDAWEEGRHDDSKYAKKVIDKIRDSISSLIKEISQQIDSTELDVEYAKEFLPYEELDNVDETFDKIGEFTNIPQDVDQKPFSIREPIQTYDLGRTSASESQGKNDSTDAPGEFDGGFEDSPNGSNDSNGGNGGKGEITKGNTSTNAGKEIDNSVTESTDNTTPKSSVLKVQKRIFRPQNSTHYVLSITSSKTSKLKLVFKYSGEETKAKTNFSIKEANTQDPSLKYTFKENSMIIEAEAEQPYSFNLYPKIDLNASIEVNAYEIKTT